MPPPVPKSASAPSLGDFFCQRMFVWAPMRMFGIPFKCPTCKVKMHHAGIYPKVWQVIDLDTTYYLVGGEYPRCSKCKLPVCPWSDELLRQLHPSQRSRFPAVLTTRLALDRKCVTLMKPRTEGNSTSYNQKALEEIHSEEWGRRVIEYLAACELHKRGTALTQSTTEYEPPPPYTPLPLAQWFESVHSNSILTRLDEHKGIITSTYGKILKIDSTKRVSLYINKIKL